LERSHSRESGNPVRRRDISEGLQSGFPLLALIVLVSGIAVWSGLKFLSHSLRVQVEEKGGGHKEVSINTPVGSIEVHHEVNEDQQAFAANFLACPGQIGTPRDDQRAGAQDVLVTYFVICTSN
jgi:hypothetical protein